MSGFDLPPTIGYGHPGSARASIVPGLQGPQRGVEGLPGEAPATVGDSSFESALETSLGAMRGAQKDVDRKYTDLVLGKDVELHDVMIASGKSEVMFNLMIEVRNKLVDAWEKLSRAGG